MKRREFMTLIGSAVVGGAAIGGAAWPLVAGAQQPSGSLDGALRKVVDDKAIPGVVAMATDRQRTLYQGAFGMADMATGRALAADALFRIASMTKAITSTAAMQLIEQGRFGLDDPVEKYLPAFARLQVFESFDPATGAYRLHPATRIATVRHLMTHTSGLGYPFTSATLRDFKPRAGEDYPVGPLLFEPGERWHYGTSTDWLGRLVEAVSGRPLDEYFRLRVLEPLGMADTFYNVPADKQARLVAVHHRDAGGAIVKDAVQPAPTVNPIIGGGGLSSTASDYIRFVRMILNDGALDGVRILKADTVEAMSRNQIGTIGVPALKTALPGRSDDFSFVADGRDKWGLGFLITADQVPGKRSAGSLSWGGIYNTYFWIDRSRGVAGVILTQFLPFADRKALALYDTFERGVYQLADATR
jgi:CubicO group peptidase (beta-lactamase class C family)